MVIKNKKIFEFTNVRYKNRYNTVPLCSDGKLSKLSKICFRTIFKNQQ